jgi:phage/plasmid-like protein (TIGR03299 family)
MAHGIKELDRLAVGFVEKYGSTWHGHPNCKEIDGAVSFEEAEAVFNYNVEKVPTILAGTAHLEEPRFDKDGKELPMLGGILIPGSHSLIRKDGEDEKITIVYPAVGDRYYPIQNYELLTWVEAGILLPYDVSIESVGTLLNGQKAFVNIILNEHTVPGDDSKTITRMMYSNSFGQESYQACVHTTRIVCNNTLRISLAQGATNKTLRKFRHTKNASMKIEEHLVELADVIASTRDHRSQMDVLATMKVTSKQVDDFMDMIFPLDKDANGDVKEGRGTTRRTNQRDAILNIFENCDNLQGGIARTRYSLLQACTDWADHDSSVRNGDDKMGRFWDGIWGTKDKFKQSALDSIMALR